MSRISEKQRMRDALVLIERNLGSLIAARYSFGLPDFGVCDDILTEMRRSARQALGYSPEATRIRKGMCFGCPWDLGADGTEMAYNYGCLPSIGEATQMAKSEDKAWACHSEPDKMCCGYAAQEKADIGKPLLVNGYHGHDGPPEVRPVPEYGEWLPKIWDQYLINLVGWPDSRSWARLPANFRWHELWDRITKAIEAHRAETGTVSVEDESAVPAGEASNV